MKCSPSLPTFPIAKHSKYSPTSSHLLLNSILAMSLQISALQAFTLPILLHPPCPTVSLPISCEYVSSLFVCIFEAGSVQVARTSQSWYVEDPVSFLFCPRTTQNSVSNTGSYPGAKSNTLNTSLPRLCEAIYMVMILASHHRICYFLAQLLY